MTEEEYYKEMQKWDEYYMQLEEEEKMIEKEKEKKSFVDTFCNFMSDPAGLTQEEIKEGLENLGVDTEKLKARVDDVVKKYSKELRGKSENQK